MSVEDFEFILKRIDDFFFFKECVHKNKNTLMQQCKLPVEKIYTNKNKEKKANIKSKNKLAKNKK